MRLRLSLVALIFVACALPARAAVVCPNAVASTMVDSVSSNTAYPGQVFRFKTTAAGTINGIAVPAGTFGYGIVRSAVGASNRARNGILILSARYLVLGNQQIQVIEDPLEQSILTHDASLAGQGTSLIPVPGVGFALSQGIHGTNITVGPGATFRVIGIPTLSQHAPCAQVAATPSPSH